MCACGVCVCVCVYLCVCVCVCVDQFDKSSVFWSHHCRRNSLQTNDEVFTAERRVVGT